MVQPPTLGVLAACFQSGLQIVSALSPGNSARVQYLFTVLLVLILVTFGVVAWAFSVCCVVARGQCACAGRVLSGHGPAPSPFRAPAPRGSLSALFRFRLRFSGHRIGSSLCVWDLLLSSWALGSSVLGGAMWACMVLAESVSLCGLFGIHFPVDGHLVSFLFLAAVNRL